MTMSNALSFVAVVFHLHGNSDRPVQIEAYASAVEFSQIVISKQITVLVPRLQYSHSLHAMRVRPKNKP